jgi:L-serine dehydratase
MISAFELFKIGIGPSSSHTVGPMVAGRRFREELAGIEGIARLRATLFGSLAWTGRGHGSDTAIVLGLLGETPAHVDPDAVPRLVAGQKAAAALTLPDGRHVGFDPVADLVFDFDVVLPGHSNGMRFEALDADGVVIHGRDFYSIGGGFVVADGENHADGLFHTPYCFDTGEDLLAQTACHGMTIAELQFAHEASIRPAEEVNDRLDEISDTMFASIERGLTRSGRLPGGLEVERRAAKLYRRLADETRSSPRPAHEVMDWVGTFAMAVNEENAAGGRIVTAPTNGAAGIIPAVLRYFRDFCPEYTPERRRIFLLSAAAIGTLIKRNASISGAEVGCQGEVGSAASMAAAGLAAALGGTPQQIENAAEIAMEHHLGLTCDPVGGLVQIPCIERNGFGANKAIAAASLALAGDGIHHVSLDAVIETMRQTGHDMQSKYKETSQGGLAVNVAAC